MNNRARASACERRSPHGVKFNPTALATARSTLLYRLNRERARPAPPKSCDVAAKMAMRDMRIEARAARLPKDTLATLVAQAYAAHPDMRRALDAAAAEHDPTPEWITAVLDFGPLGAGAVGAGLVGGTGGTSLQSVATSVGCDNAAARRDPDHDNQTIQPQGLYSEGFVRGGRGQRRVAVHCHEIPR